MNRSYISSLESQCLYIIHRSSLRCLLPNFQTPPPPVPLHYLQYGSKRLLRRIAEFPASPSKQPSPTTSIQCKLRPISATSTKTFATAREQERFLSATAARGTMAAGIQQPSSSKPALLWELAPLPTTGSLFPHPRVW